METDEATGQDVDINHRAIYNQNLIFRGKLGGIMPKYEAKHKDKKNVADEGTSHNIASLGSSLFLKGELSGHEDLVIEGEFQGKIDIKDSNLSVGRKGKVKAEIRAKNVTISGSVQGNIYASGKVFISEEAQMKGDISAARISIMDGAQFKGTIKMEKGINNISPPKEKTDTLPSKEEDKPENETPSS